MEADDKDIQLIVALQSEEATVVKRRVSGDTVKVRTITSQSDYLVDEVLNSEQVEVTRVPIGRDVEVTPEIIQTDEFTIIPIVEEVVIVQRKLVLKEEIHIRRVRVTTRHTEVVSLREQEAIITRTGH